MSNLETFCSSRFNFLLLFLHLFNIALYSFFHFFLLELSIYSYNSVSILLSPHYPTYKKIFSMVALHSSATRWLSKKKSEDGSGGGR